MWPYATTEHAKPLTERSLAGSKGQPDIFPGPEGQEKIEHLEINPQLMDYLMRVNERCLAYMTTIVISFAVF